MTRTQALKAISDVLGATGTPPIPQTYARNILAVLDEALDLEPEIVECSAELHGVGRFA